MVFPVPPELLAIIAFAAICLVAGLLCVRAMVHVESHGSEAWEVLSLGLPIAAAGAGVFCAAGPGAAFVLLVAVAVTLLLFAGGVAILVAPRPRGEIPTVHSPVSGQVLAVAMIVLLVGFASRLTIAGVFGLLLVALTTLDLLRTPAGEAASHDATGSSARDHRGIRRVLGMLTALLPAAVMVFSAWRLAKEAGEPSSFAPAEVALVNLLAPALAVPTVRHTTRLSAKGNLTKAINIAGGTAVLVVGLLVPALVGTEFLLGQFQTDAPMRGYLNHITWRLDGSMLLVCGMAMVGLRLGVLAPQRWLGILQILLYGAYLMASTLFRSAHFL